MFNLIQELIKLGTKIYYMDTDSLYLDKELPSKYIGKELGKMKLENIFKEIE
jgi:DNA polymerase elongation subunit (family B)